ncbi:hypothetical protein PVAP13_4KG352476 [Panicum virgatum]|nr:hypothetical protein PVAP13_4KG352476 [Panicum virgatum]
MPSRVADTAEPRQQPPWSQGRVSHLHGAAGEATRKPPRPHNHATADLHAAVPHAVALQTLRRVATAPHSQLAARSRTATGRCCTISQLQSRPHAQTRPRSLGHHHLQCLRVQLAAGAALGRAITGSGRCGAGSVTPRAPSAPGAAEAGEPPSGG